MEPLVSIITPSYNNGPYIEETIRNILEQDYPKIEHIIVDGASQDNTVEILKKYNEKIQWISEPDKGMYNAINKGFAMAKGEILTYINADDLYYSKGAVRSIVNEFMKKPSVDFVFGHCAFIDVTGKVLYIYKAPFFNRTIALAYPRIIFHQPTCFWRKRVHIPFDNNLKYCGDSNFFLYLCKSCVGKNTHRVIAKFRVREDSIAFKNRERMGKESEQLFGRPDAEWKTPLILSIFDLVYIRTFLNFGANIKRFLLHLQKRPYL